MVSKDKLKQLFSPSLTGKDTYSADEILLSIETMPDNEPTFWQVYEYCDKRNWAVIPMENIDDEVPKLSIPIEWILKWVEKYNNDLDPWFQGRTAVDDMLDDWVKENEQSSISD